MTFPTDNDDPRDRFENESSLYDDPLADDEQDQSADDSVNKVIDSTANMYATLYDRDEYDLVDSADGFDPADQILADETSAEQIDESYAYQSAAISGLASDGAVITGDTPVSDDAGAAGDLQRANRADLFQTERRSQSSMVTLALMLIGLGAGLLVDLFTPESVLLTPPLLVGVVIVAISVGLLGRYLINGRREVGLLFLGLGLAIALALGLAFSTGLFDPAALLPTTIIAFGITLILLIFFGARERGLLLPGLILCVVGVVLLPYALGLIPVDLLDTIRAYYPVLLVVAGILLLPVAFRRRA